MKYRIIATIVLLLAIGGAAYIVENADTRTASPAPQGKPNDKDLSGLKIN